MPTFSAALLLGGQSRRMGRDKALLPHPAGGLFWERQLAVLESLGPEEIFWSGSPRPDMPAHARAVEDAVKDSGPLGGLAACLAVTRTDLLVVLAIDLIHIRDDFFRRLLESSTSTCGAVVNLGSHYEPLAAVYPRGVREIAEAHLAAKRLALQDLVRDAEAAGLMKVIEGGNDAEEQLRNVNVPGDLGFN